MIRVGTRGSALALAQAGWVAGQLPEAELVTITTAGDRDRAAGDKSRWVGELERALLEERIDLAVHSAKDVPAELPDGLELVAFPPRADPHDVICGAPSLAALPADARVGTSSLRREAQVRAARQDLQVIPLRGNVDTRLRRLDEGRAEALVLAAAGLQRLGRREAADGVLDDFVPAPGQGALALEARAATIPREALQALDDPATATCVGAERELTRELGASCNTPVGAHARLHPDGQLALRAWVGMPDGSAWLADRVIGPSAGLGAAAAARLRAAGVEQLLAEAEEALR